MSLRRLRTVLVTVRAFLDGGDDHRNGHGQEPHDGHRQQHDLRRNGIDAFNGSTESALSSTEAATTVVFTDAVLTGVSAKAVHVTQLQTAVNAMRAAASLSPATFSSVANGGTIRLTHLNELRTSLNAARSAIGLPVLTYTDPNPAAGTTTIKGAHVLELRGGTQ